MPHRNLNSDFVKQQNEIKQVFHNVQRNYYMPENLMMQLVKAVQRSNEQLDEIITIYKSLQAGQKTAIPKECFEKNSASPPDCPYLSD